jgi:hypothetical protein
MPLRKAGGGAAKGVMSEAFLEGRKSHLLQHLRKCEATAKATGERCRQPAMRDSRFCLQHGGHRDARLAEEARWAAVGKVVIIPKRTRKASLAQLGAGPLPEDMPWKDSWDVLGPTARGQLIEAWQNRLTAPDVWKKEWTRPRYRRVWSKAENRYVDIAL